MTGIHYLLRANELIGLTLGDVGETLGSQGRQTTLHLRSSKTDQEGCGEFVGRDCVCWGTQQDHVCPAHILSNHVRARILELQEVGGARSEAPLLFTDGEGKPESLLEPLDLSLPYSRQCVRVPPTATVGWQAQGEDQRGGNAAKTAHPASASKKL